MSDVSAGFAPPPVSAMSPAAAGGGGAGWGEAGGVARAARRRRGVGALLAVVLSASVLVPSGPVGGQSAPLAGVEFAGVYTDPGAYTPDVRSSVSHVEGASGFVDYRVTVSLENPNDGITKLVVCPGGTAAYGVDYDIRSTTQEAPLFASFSGGSCASLSVGSGGLFGSGDKESHYRLRVYGDLAPEDDETVTLTVTVGAPANGATVAAGKGVATLTITDDDWFVNSDGDVVVPADWALIPDGLDSGDRFRLLFRTTARRDATATDIAVYDRFVQGELRGGALAAELGPYVSGFRAVGSTGSVELRDHLGLGSGDPWVWGSGVPVYWMDDAGEGALVADDYEDFCDREGTGDNPQVWWKNDLLTDQRSEDGTAMPAGDDNWPWTGSTNECRKHGGGHLGRPVVAVGAHRVTATSGREHGPLQNGAGGGTNTDSNSLYGMSPAFTVAPVGGPVYVSLAPNLTIFAVEGGSAQSDVFSVSLSRSLAAGEVVRAALASVADVTLSLGPSRVRSRGGVV